MRILAPFPDKVNSNALKYIGVFRKQPVDKSFCAKQPEVKHLLTLKHYTSPMAETLTPEEFELEYQSQDGAKREKLKRPSPESEEALRTYLEKLTEIHAMLSGLGGNEAAINTLEGEMLRAQSLEDALRERNPEPPPLITPLPETSNLGYAATDAMTLPEERIRDVTAAPDLTPAEYAPQKHQAETMVQAITNTPSNAYDILEQAVHGEFDQAVQTAYDNPMKTAMAASVMSPGLAPVFMAAGTAVGVFKWLSGGTEASPTDSLQPRATPSNGTGMGEGYER